MIGNKGGRPQHEPTPETQRIVEALAGFAIPQMKIAQVIQISMPTLEKHYRAELDRGAAVVEAKLVGNLLRLAQGNDGTALKAVIFSLTTRFGWSAYVPLPRDAPLGKKETANLEAQSAHEGSEWSDLIH